MQLFKVAAHILRGVYLCLKRFNSHLKLPLLVLQLCDLAIALPHSSLVSSEEFQSALL